MFENHVKPSLTVKKLDSVTGEPVKGAKFRVAYGSNQTFTGEINELGDFFTDENGQIVIEKLKDGWYCVTELEPAAGYAIKEPATQEFYLKAGEGKTVIFENTPLSALVVFKYDSVTGEAVKDAVFQVRYLSGTSGTGGTVIGTYKTGVNGSFTVTGLEVGAYVIDELTSDSGHVLNTTPQTITVKGGSSAQTVTTTSAVVVSDGSAANQLTFYDTTIGKLELVKVDAANKNMRLADATFEIRRMDQGVVTTVTTGRNGRAVVELDAGSYYAVETEAPDGYQLDDTPHYFTVRDGKTTTVTVTNKAVSGITIHKTDAVTGEGIYGVSFLLYDARNHVVGQYTSDNKGYVRIEGIEAGRYRVRELENEGCSSLRWR